MSLEGYNNWIAQTHRLGETLENWTDKEFLEDATFITQEEYDALKIDREKPINIVLYPMAMTWEVE